MRCAAGRERAGARRRAVVLALLAGTTLVASGCATKRDVRTLQQEVAALRLQQDSLLTRIQQQNDRLLDTLRTSMSITQDVRGQTSHRFQQLEATLSQTQALVGQLMQMSQDLMNRLSNIPAAPGPNIPRNVSGGGTAEEYYQLGLEKMGERAYTAARAAFQQLVSEFPEDARAPDAQFQIGELYYLADEKDLAIRELEKVAEQWPSAQRAPASLYRAGVIAQEEEQNGKARELYNRVINQYSGSSEAGLARTKLRSLPRS
jgi:tol-pal system protein YbgF